MKHVFVASDIHVPFHSPQLLDAHFRLLGMVTRAVDLDEFHIVGDLYDMECLSRFPVNLLKTIDVKEELQCAHHAYWNRLKEAINFDETHTIFHEGNHEARLYKFLVSRAPQLQSLIAPRDVFDPPVRTYLSYNEVWKPAPRIAITHGTRARKHSGQSAWALMEEIGSSHIVVGHCHRAADYFWTDSQGTWRMVELGHLADENSVPQVDKIQQNWQECLGALLSWEQSDGSDLSVELFPVVNNRTLFRGHRIEVY